MAIRLEPDRKAESSISVEGLQKLRRERTAVRELSKWEEQTFDTLVDWAANGCPDDATSYPPPLEGRHVLPGETLHLALDSLAKFVSKGYISGPINPSEWPLQKPPHCIGIFTREYASHGTADPGLILTFVLGRKIRSQSGYN